MGEPIRHRHGNGGQPGQTRGWGHILPWILLKAAIIQTGILYQHWHPWYSKDKKVHQEEPAHLRVNSDAKEAK